MNGKSGESPALARNREQGRKPEHATVQRLFEREGPVSRLICKPGDRPGGDLSGFEA